MPSRTHVSSSRGTARGVLASFGLMAPHEMVFTMRAEFESAADLAVSIKGGWGLGTNKALDTLER